MSSPQIPASLIAAGLLDSTRGLAPESTRRTSERRGRTLRQFLRRTH